MEKLRSALKQMHWSLLLRAAIFAASWLYLPFSIFFLIALYLYFIPLFQPWRLLVPVLVVIFFAAIETPAPWLAILLGAAWFLILGIKDLIFIDRKSEYEMLVLLLTFLMAARYFFYFDSWEGQLPLLSSFVMGLAAFLLCNGYVRYGEHTATPSGKKRTTIYAGATAVMLTELSLVVLVLPLHFLYQASLFFVASAAILELLFEHVKGTLTRNVILVNFSIFFAFLVIILGSAQWTL